MKKSRFTEEQIIGFLRQAEAGMPIKVWNSAIVCRFVWQLLAGQYAIAPKNGNHSSGFRGGRPAISAHTMHLSGN